MCKTLAGAAAALTACAVLTTPTPTQAATLATAGTGWKIATQLGVTSISPSRTYTITFATETLRKRYTPLLAPAVPQSTRPVSTSRSVGSRR
ncbi:hypothetical protein [Streptomyces lydicus]|uniref:hypothetical protein n=1 Tax=Streptomyces lydicus TaxID=47763 RepID=UPI00379F00E1